MSFDYFFFREEFKTGNDVATKLLYHTTFLTCQFIFFWKYEYLITYWLLLKPKANYVSLQIGSFCGDMGMGLCRGDAN